MNAILHAAGKLHASKITSFVILLIKEVESQFINLIPYCSTFCLDQFLKYRQ